MAKEDWRKESYKRIYNESKYKLRNTWNPKNYKKIHYDRYGNERKEYWTEGRSKPNAVYKNKQRIDSGGCFITSACIEAKDLPDNCYELETLRAFRNEKLLKTDKGIQLIKRYYTIAPRIVNAINNNRNSKEIYNQIYKKILKVTQLIENGKRTKAISVYNKMVDDLKADYLKYD